MIPSQACPGAFALVISLLPIKDSYIFGMFFTPKPKWSLKETEEKQQHGEGEESEFVVAAVLMQDSSREDPEL